MTTPAEDAAAAYFDAVDAGKVTEKNAETVIRQAGGLVNLAAYLYNNP